MTSPAVTVSLDDREYYPIHEEDDVPEIDFHKVQTTDLYDALRAHFPDRFVSGNICIYWERGNTRDYRAPDVFVADGFPDEPHPRVYHIWRDPPVLLAIEIGSRSTFREDEGPKQEIYEQKIHARYYLYSNPPKGELCLWRLGSEGYAAVPLELNDRVRIPELGLEFGIEDGFLRIYTPEGERLRTHTESEAFAVEEAQRRKEAEARAAEESRRREEAEARAVEERRQREELERQLAEVRAQLEARQEGTP